MTDMTDMYTGTGIYVDEESSDGDGDGGGDGGGRSVGWTLTEADELPAESTFVLAGCQSLVQLPGAAGLAGDPLEMAAMEAIGWSQTKGDVIAPLQGGSPAGAKLRRLRRFDFSSALRRMSVIVEAETGKGKGGMHCMWCCVVLYDAVWCCVV